MIAKNDEGEYVEKEENGVAYYQASINLNTQNASIPPFFKAWQKIAQTYPCQYILRAAKQYIRILHKVML